MASILMRKLGCISDESFIATILAAATVMDAANTFGVDHKTVNAELRARGLPSFTEFRKDHGIVTKRQGEHEWSDDDVVTLRAMLAQGKSAALIGDALGLSKNAVIGKCHRLGILLGQPQHKKPETSPRRSPDAGEAEGSQQAMPAIKRPYDPRRPVVVPSSVRKLEAERLAQATRAADRALVDRAIAEGRITRCEPGHAFGTDLRSWVQGIAS